MRTALEPPKPDNPTYRRLQEFQRIMSVSMATVVDISVSIATVVCISIGMVDVSVSVLYVSVSILCFINKRLSFMVHNHLNLNVLSPCEKKTC